MYNMTNFKYWKLNRKYTAAMVRKVAFNLCPSVALLYAEEKDVKKLQRLVHKYIKKLGIKTMQEDNHTVVLENGNTISFTPVKFI